MGSAEWVIASNIRSITDAMCAALSMVGKKLRNGDIEATTQQDMMAWAIELGRPEWTEGGENVFVHKSGGQIRIEESDDIKTLTLKIVLVEQGAEELTANGLTREKISKLIDDEVKECMKR